MVMRTEPSKRENRIDSQRDQTESFVHIFSAVLSLGGIYSVERAHMQQSIGITFYLQVFRTSKRTIIICFGYYYNTRFSSLFRLQGHRTRVSKPDRNSTFVCPCQLAYYKTRYCKNIIIKPTVTWSSINEKISDDDYFFSL